MLQAMKQSADKHNDQELKDYVDQQTTPANDPKM